MTQHTFTVFDDTEILVAYYKLARIITESTDVIYDLLSIQKLKNDKDHDFLGIVIKPNETESTWNRDELKTMRSNGILEVYIKYFDGVGYTLISEYIEEGKYVAYNPLTRVLGMY